MANPVYCSACGGKLSRGVPQGDHTERRYCKGCGSIAYSNPVPVVLCLLHTKERLLMVRRAIPPYTGSWAPPGGFIDEGESIDAAAIREVREETGIDVVADSLIPYSIISIPAINQICLVCRSELDFEVEPEFGDEIFEARWFTKKEMPMDEYFLPAHVDGLELFFDSLESGRFRVFMAEASYEDGFNRSVRLARNRP